MFERLWNWICADVKISQAPDTCTKCSGHLHRVNRVRATCVNEQGQRYPSNWTYYACAKCDSKFKIFLNGKVETVTEKEWAVHCKRYDG